MAKNILLTGALALVIAPWVGAQNLIEVRNTPTTASVYAPERIELLTGFETGMAGFRAEIKLPEAQAGRWSAPLLWTPYARGGTGTAITGLVGIHTHVTPDGKVLSWEGHNDNTGAGHLSHAYVWNPNPSARNGTQSYPDVYDHYDNESNNLFCSGHSFLANGKLLVAGGHYSEGPVDRSVITYNDVPYDYAAIFKKYVGLRDINTFNYIGSITAGSNYVWQSSATDPNNPGLPPATLPAMTYRRWYPTVTTLADGRALVTAGQQFGDPNAIGGARQAENPEVYNAATKTWQELTAVTRRLPTYPWMFQAPNGQVFNAGPNPDAKYLDVNAANGAWGTTTYPSQLNTERYAGTAVMYQPGKILILGGENQNNGTVTATAERIDLTATTPVWQTDAPMRFPRFHVNSTLLADGTVLVTGGTRQVSTEDNAAALPAELWTPPAAGTGNGAWTTMNAMARPRLYHSTAVLLPDATVLSTGGGQGGYFTDHPDYEIFTPPYLCKGLIRPEISSAPRAVAYGQAFAVYSPDASSVVRATWVRLSSVTHSFNMNQRFLDLSLTHNPATPGQLTIQAPADANLCPPGHYMLFLLDAAGVPSVASIVAITGNACAASLSLSSAVISQSACQQVNGFTVSSTVNCQADYRWTINGTYMANFDGASYVELTTTADAPTMQVQVEATRNCVGGSVTTYTSFTNYFPTCPWEPQ